MKIYFQFKMYFIILSYIIHRCNKIVLLYNVKSFFRSLWHILGTYTLRKKTYFTKVRIPIKKIMTYVNKDVFIHLKLNYNLVFRRNVYPCMWLFRAEIKAVQVSNLAWADPASREKTAAWIKINSCLNKDKQLPE